MADEIKITKRGEDGYRVSSVRLKNELWDALSDMAAKSGRSRNDVISILLQHGIENAVIGAENG